MNEQKMMNNILENMDTNEEKRAVWKHCMK
jgi:hypothetical protein